MKLPAVFIPVLSCALLALPAHAALALGLTIFGDDFESPSTLPEETAVAGIPGWTVTGAAGSFIGRFNADDDTGIDWYHGVPGTDFEDTSSSGGVVNSMNGPTKGTIFKGADGDNISLDIGSIDAGTIYSAVIALSGGRTAAGDSPDGYSIDLLSGSTVLASTSGSAADTALLLFDDVTVSWDSSTLPGGVNIGDILTFRLSVDGAGSAVAGKGYLDFDDVIFSQTIVPEPSSLLLLGLGGLALTRRRRA